MGLKPLQSKDYVLTSWLDFGSWEQTAVKMLLKFVRKLVDAPRGSFLAALLTELRSDCLRSKDAWLFGVLRLLSSGLSFQPARCLVGRVDNMLERIRSGNLTLLTQILADRFAVSELKTARDRLAGRPGGPYTKLRVLQSWISRDGDPPPRFCMRKLPFSRTSFKLLAQLMLGELPVNRVNAYWFFENQRENQRQYLGNFGTTWYGKRACLHCFLNGDTVVLDSEWHWLFNCVHFHELRHKRPFLQETLKSIQRIC